MATPERSATIEAEKAVEEMLDEQLQAAGLVNVPSKVREWIQSSDAALKEVLRLSDKGFGETIKNDSDAQAALMEVFVEAAVLSKLRETDNTPDAPVNVDAIIDDLMPAEATGIAVQDDISSLDTVAPAAAQEMSGRTPESSVATRSAGSFIADRVIARPQASVDEQVARAVSEAEAPQDKPKKHRLAKIGGGALIVLSALGFGGGVAENIATANNTPQQTSQEVELAAQQLTLEQKQAFFANAVDVHALPGREGNNFGPGLTDDDMRIDTPEQRQKVIDQMSEMVKGNVNIMVSYMYSFDLAGPKIDGANAAERIQQLQALAAHLSDPQFVTERYDAYQKVVAIFNTISGGVRDEIDNHVSFYIDPSNKLGVDRNVQASNAVYYDYDFNLNAAVPGAEAPKEKTLGVFEGCGRQTFTVELQGVPLEVLISHQVVETPQPVVQTVEQPIVTEQPPVVTEQPPITTPLPPVYHPPELPPQPPRLTPKTNEYPAHSNLTSTLGPGQNRQPAVVQTVRTTHTNRQVGTGRTEGPINDTVTNTPRTRTGAQDRSPGVTRTTQDTSGNVHSGSGMGSTSNNNENSGSVGQR